MIAFTRHQEISDQWITYKEAINRYILKIVKDQETADHLAHEVLMKVYASCCSGKTIKNVRSWLFQIAYNTCMDHFKQERKTIALEADVVVRDEDQIYQEASVFVKPLIGLLPEKYAVPLYLSEIDNFKQKEVAEKLGLSLSATKSRILRGKEMLRDKIVECVHLEVDVDGRLEDFQIKKDCSNLAKGESCCA